MSIHPSESRIRNDYFWRNRKNIWIHFKHFFFGNMKTIFFPKNIQNQSVIALIHKNNVEQPENTENQPTEENTDTTAGASL